MNFENDQPRTQSQTANCVFDASSLFAQASATLPDARNEAPANLTNFVLALDSKGINPGGCVIQPDDRLHGWRKTDRITGSSSDNDQLLRPRFDPPAAPDRIREFNNILHRVDSARTGDRFVLSGNGPHTQLRDDLARQIQPNRQATTGFVQQLIDNVELANRIGRSVKDVIPLLSPDGTIERPIKLPQAIAKDGTITDNNTTIPHPTQLPHESCVPGQQSGSPENHDTSILPQRPQVPAESSGKTRPSDQHQRTDISESQLSNPWMKGMADNLIKTGKVGDFAKFLSGFPAGYQKELIKEMNERLKKAGSTLQLKMESFPVIVCGDPKSQGTYFNTVVRLEDQTGKVLDAAKVSEPPPHRQTTQQDLHRFSANETTAPQRMPGKK